MYKKYIKKKVKVFVSKLRTNIDIVFNPEKMIYLSDIAKRKINYSETQCTPSNADFFLDEAKLVETKVFQQKITFLPLYCFCKKYLLLSPFID